MRYVIYTRKSTEEDDRQVLSIEAQLVELREFAAKEKLEIVTSFEEAKTAKEPGRTKFAEMLAFLESGKADGILSWHPDRLARNSVDGGRIIHMIDQGKIKSLRFPVFWFEPTPQGLFMLNIAFGQSKYFVDNLRENVKRGLRQKIRNGVWPGWAPVGYINNPKTRMVDIDEAKADKVRTIFVLYATGKYTLYSLSNWCKENGLRSNTSKDICVSNIHKLLQNIFYIGLMKYKGEVFEGTHKPLISKKLFDKCQEILNQRGKPQKVKKHTFAFLGFMKCSSCGASITAEKQKGHNYYRCTKKKGACQEKHYLREEELVKQVKDFLTKVSLTSQDKEKILNELNKEDQQAKEQAKQTVQNLKVELAQVEQKLEKLLDVYLNEVISTDEYTKRKHKLINQKLNLQDKIKDFEQNGLSWLEPAKEFLSNLEKANNLKNIGSNHILQNRKWLFEPQIPYQMVEKQTQNLTFPKWCPGEDSNLHALRH